MGIELTMGDRCLALVTCCGAHREENGWRQRDVAGRIGSNQSQVSKWEIGHDDFGWAVDYFFDKLLVLFSYPDDLLDWWADFQLARMEEALSKARSYREQIVTRHDSSAPVLLKLDRLIEQSQEHY